MENNLPKNWTFITIKEVSSLVRGVTYKKNEAKNIKEGNDYLVLRGGNIQDGEIVESDDQVFVENGLVKDEQNIKNGDVVIVGSTGSKKLIGKAGVAKKNYESVSFGAFLMLLRPFDEINKSYFNYFFLSDQYREEIRVLAGGININNIRRQYIEDMYFPLPPLPEQNRIVEKLDVLFGQLELIKQSLNNIPQLLKDFRQQVLTQAVTGKLTAEWRVHRNFGKWKSKNIEEISTLVTSGSRGWAKYYSDKGSKFVRAQNINKDYLDLSDIAYVKLPEKIEGTRTLIKQNDILITITGANVTKTAHVNYNLHDSYVSQHVSLVRFKNLYNPKYIHLFLICESHGKKQLLDFAYGQGKPQLNLSNIKAVSINLPSIAEQDEIVNRVESLFAKADSIEKHYEALKQNIHNLPQTILHKAFKGELVPQLATDGDAKTLLAEIKALKAATKTKPATKKKTVKNYTISKTVLGQVAEDS